MAVTNLQFFEQPPGSENWDLDLCMFGSFTDKDYKEIDQGLVMDKFAHAVLDSIFDHEFCSMDSNLLIKHYKDLTIECTIYRKMVRVTFVGWVVVGQSHQLDFFYDQWKFG